jgi:hypothetical protein
MHVGVTSQQAATVVPASVALPALFIIPEGHMTSLVEIVFPAHMPVMSSQQFATVGLLPTVGCVGLAFAFLLLLEQVKSEQVLWSQQVVTVVPVMSALFILSL